jgi:Asp-tRNA(Asn)/Glu-tRNA(Gln) amidotransferase C subunit
MANDNPLAREDVQSLARLANLDLPDNRLDQLQTTLATYLENLARLRTVDSSDAEPPAITYESETRR